MKYVVNLIIAILYIRCGHCKRLVPEYEVAATALLTNDPPIPLVKVDCPANNELCGKFGVSGYPTLKIFRNGKFSADYQGPRNSGKACCLFCLNNNNIEERLDYFQYIICCNY